MAPAGGALAIKKSINEIAGTSTNWRISTRFDDAHAKPAYLEHYAKSALTASAAYVAAVSLTSRRRRFIRASAALSPTLRKADVVERYDPLPQWYV